MPYEAPGESFGSFGTTAHYVRKYKAYQPTFGPPRPKTVIDMRKGAPAYSRARNIARQEAKRCMQRLAEKKHSTTSLAQTPTAIAGNVISAVVLSQGTSATTRTGNQIHISSISIEGLAFIATNVAADDYRIIVGWDRQPDGAQVTVGTVLEGGINTNYNKDQVKPNGRIAILYDRHLALNQPNAGAAIGGAVVPVRYRKKLDTVVYYQSNAGTISDVLKNNLFVLQISSNAIAQFTGTVQICFTDL